MTAGKSRLIAELVSRFRPQLEPFFSVKTTVELIAGKYEKVQELGIGRFGVVWKARDVFALEPSQYYVLKIPQTKDYNQRFLREGRILKKLEGQGVEVLACTTCLEYFDLATWPSSCPLTTGHPGRPGSGRIWLKKV